MTQYMDKAREHAKNAKTLFTTPDDVKQYTNLYMWFLKIVLLLGAGLVIIMFATGIFIDVDIENLQPAQQVIASAKASNVYVEVEAIQGGTGADTPIQMSSNLGADNDGLVRQLADIYGHFSSVPPLDNRLKYYDVAIPYKVTINEIGGIQNYAHDYEYGNQTGGDYWDENTKQIIGAGAYANGDYCGAPGSRGGTASVPGFTAQFDPEYGAEYIEVGGEKFFMSSIQPFYLAKHMMDGWRHKDAFWGVDPTQDSKSPFEYYNVHWSISGSSRPIFDVIWTDDTVTHFVCTDANAAAHTNHNLGMEVGNPPIDLQNTNQPFFHLGELYLPQYCSMYSSCQPGKSLEIAGTSGSRGSALEYFTVKLGVDREAPDGKRVKYYRMYDCTIAEYARVAGN